MIAAWHTVAGLKHAIYLVKNYHGKKSLKRPRSGWEGDIK
jgi:hypothetical protein